MQVRNSIQQVPRVVTHRWMRILAAFLLCAAMTITASTQTFTTLVNFSGFAPIAGLVQGFDGHLYGPGNLFGNIYFFKITKAGKLTVIPLTCALVGTCTGSGINGPLALGPYGDFWGTTLFDSNLNAGTVYRFTPGGTWTQPDSFCAKTNCTDGSTPYGALVLGSDGSFYGTTSQRGNSTSSGTAFKIGLGGTLRTIHEFCSKPGCTDGATPLAGLLQGVDGNFYGTASGGGANKNSSLCSTGCGTVFKMTPEGVLTTLYSFVLKQTAWTVPSLPRR